MVQKRATIKDVAALAGFSTAVVSYVLNDSKEKSIPQATREKIWNAAQQLGYVPNSIACSLRSQSARAIGVVPYWSMETTVFGQILQGILDICTEREYATVLCKPKQIKDDFSYLNDFRRRRVDGFILICPPEGEMRIDEEEHARKISESHAPFVMVNCHKPLRNTACVNIDYFGSTVLATEYLINKGHREITYAAPLSVQSMEYFHRLEGYRYVMKKHSLSPALLDIEEIPARIAQCSAVVTNKTDTAQRILQEAIRQGISVPSQLSVIAGNTEDYSHLLYPPLTTAKIPAEQIGRSAVTALFEQLNGNAKKEQKTLPCTILERSSVAQK